MPAVSLQKSILCCRILPWPIGLHDDSNLDEDYITKGHLSRLITDHDGSKAFLYQRVKRKCLVKETSWKRKNSWRCSILGGASCVQLCCVIQHVSCAKYTSDTVFIFLVRKFIVTRVVHTHLALFGHGVCLAYQRVSYWNSNFLVNNRFCNFFVFT